MKGLFAICLLFLPLMLFAQGKYDANWCFGYRAGIDFSDIANVTVFLTSCDNGEAVGSISDSSGNLLFYLTDAWNNCNTNYNPNCNTYNIVDRNGNNIINGDSIKTNYTITNGILVLPDPANATRYFILHLDIDNNTAEDHLYYSIVKIDNGQLSVTKKNVLVDKGPFAERIAATHTADGKGWWILLHYYYPTDTIYHLYPMDTLCTNKFALYQLSTRGLQLIHTQFIGTKFCNLIVSEPGEMTFNDDGTKLISCNFDSTTIDVINFDRCSGIMSDNNSISLPLRKQDPYGIEISNKSIYISSFRDNPRKNSLFQIRIDSLNHSNTISTIYSDSISNMYFGQLQKAPNKKIYLSSIYGIYPFYSSQNRYLSVINNPDSLGSACDFQPFSFFLGDSAKSYLGLPNFPNYNLGPLSTIWETGAGNDTSICANQDSFVKGVPLGGDSIAGVTATWQAAPGIDNIHQLRQVVYPTQSQWYYITLTDTTIVGSCQSRLDSVYVQVVDCDTTGIGEVTVSGIRIYPNPATNQLVVECQMADVRQQQSDNRFVMYDIMGQVVLSKQLTGNKTLLDVSTLSQGLYLYRIGDTAGKVQVVR